MPCKALVDAIDEEGAEWPDEWLRTATLLRQDFEQYGIHLPVEEQAKVNELHDQLNYVQAIFSQNINKPLDPIQIPARSLPYLPQHIQEMCSRVDRDTVALPLDPGTANTVLKMSPDPSVRAAVYKATSSAVENLPVLDALLTLRREFALRLGYESFAKFALSRTMAASPEHVAGFLRELSVQLRPKAETEAATVTELKEESEGSRDLTGADRAYYFGLAKSLKHDMQGASLAEYLELENCIAGMQSLCGHLFGLRFEDVTDVAALECWDGAVRKLAIHEEDGSLAGHIFLDLFQRPGKGEGAAHYTIQCGRRWDVPEERQLPVVALVCSFGSPQHGVPPLLSHFELETLFHEFGHALHSVLSRTDLQHASGTRVMIDFVETPSTLMENFVWDYRVLSLFAKHYRTGETIPASMVEQLQASRYQFSAVEMEQQVLYSLVDQLYHGQDPLRVSTTEAFRSLQEAHTMVSHEPGTHSQTKFTHLIGYAAGYYSYLWSRVYSTNIWEALFAADPLSREAGEALRHKLLAHGGAKDPDELLQDLIGPGYKSVSKLMNRLT